MASAANEGARRKPFTPGWAESLTEIEGLPIKTSGGKLVKVVRDASSRKRSSPDDEDEKVKIIDDEEDAANAEAASKAKMDAKDAAKAQRQAASENAKKRMDVKVDPKTPQQYANLQRSLAAIATHITANPEDSIIKRSKLPKSDEPQPHLEDLLVLLYSSDAHEVELSMLSATVVFKAVCPSYRIHETKEDSVATATASAQLKKETQRLADFETSLLKAYRRFLTALETRALWGLGSARAVLPEKLTVKEKLGLVALRCQCELLRGLTHFNFRSLLMEQVVSRATQPAVPVHETCAQCLLALVTKDTHGEVSAEFVAALNRVLRLSKFEIPEVVLRVLESVRVTVHADQARSLQDKAKQQRKKRRKGKDGVEMGLLEASITADELNKKRFQVNALQEIAVIYFRILKNKIGFRLLPAALEGLSRITHLLNMDTVVDLLSVLRGLLDADWTPPMEVRVLTIRCALFTLSGPGKELQVDDEPYFTHLKQLLRDIPYEFDHWKALLQCLELMLVDRREDRAPVVESVIRLLFLHASHHLQDVGHTLLNMAHSILLRYPRVRQKLILFRNQAVKTGGGNSGYIAEEDAEQSDLAMAGLLAGDLAKDLALAADKAEESLGDGSWSLSLARHSPDHRMRHLADTLASSDMIPVTNTVSDSTPKSRLDAIVSRMHNTFATIPARKGGRRIGAAEAKAAKVENHKSKKEEIKNSANSKSSGGRGGGSRGAGGRGGGGRGGGGRAGGRGGGGRGGGKGGRGGNKPRHK